MMTQNITDLYTVRGPNWSALVYVDPNTHETERDQLIEAATTGIENQWKTNEENFQLGPIVSVKKMTKSTKKTKTALVNSYLCLSNAGLHSLAEQLRDSYKSETGQDLKLDEAGYSWE